MARVRLLFLDRDGTLNRAFGSRPPNTPQEVALLPGVCDVLVRYAAKGWQTVIITNQGGIAAGYLTETQAYAVLQQTIDLLPVPVAAAYLCPHMVKAIVPEYALDCPNRKPKPGFILDALHSFGAKAEDCLLIGDAITDKQAAQAANVPFCWADRFFGRPINRGMRDSQGRWIQLRQRPNAHEEKLNLVALKNGLQIAAAFLPTERISDAIVNVETPYCDTGIAEMLLDAAREWMRWQADPNPL
jgi:D-glycero-D-manno-heptose 1,7-bisphosphate phosphatase